MKISLLHLGQLGFFMWAAGLLATFFVTVSIITLSHTITFQIALLSGEITLAVSGLGIAIMCAIPFIPQKYAKDETS